jgi:hypothetical protein
MSDLPRTRTQRVLLLAIGVVGVIAFAKQLSPFFHVHERDERNIEIRIAHPAHPLPPMPPAPPPPPPAPPAPPSF